MKKNLLTNIIIGVVALGVGIVSTATITNSIQEKKQAELMQELENSKYNTVLSNIEQVGIYGNIEGSIVSIDKGDIFTNMIVKIDNGNVLMVVRNEKIKNKNINDNISVLGQTGGTNNNIPVISVNHVK